MEQALHLGEIYGNSMALQRDTPLCIAGRGGSGTVTGELNGVQVSASVVDGAWELVFQPMPAAEGLTLTIRSGESRMDLNDANW